jgi:hypothetical protein
MISLSAVFAAREDSEDTAPPGYWGNEDEGRKLRTYIRNDQYTLETGERSRLEIPVGQDLKDEHGREGQSQRGAHKPEYWRRETCLRGDGIANIPTGGIPRLQPWEDVNPRRS